MSRPSSPPAYLGDIDFPFGANASATDDLTQQFASYHLAHPEVYEKLRDLARQAVKAGKVKIGIKTLYEVARWEFWLSTKGDGFALNNNYTSRYARLLMQQEPDLRGLFDIREVRT